MTLPSTSTPSGNDSTITYNEVVEQIKSAYQNAKLSAQQGNWADYGAYMDELEKAINRLGKTSAATDITESDSVNPDDTLNNSSL